MLYVSNKISDDLIEVTDSYEKTTRLISVGDALTSGTKVYGLHSNGTIMVYSSVQKFLDMYRMRQALCNNLVSYKIDYDTELGLIIMRSCSLSNSVVHDLIIPDFVDSIDDYVFRMCLVLRSIVIPESVKVIGDACFHECRNLESVVTKGTSELDIGYRAFADCEKLRNVHLREGIRIISAFCFDTCISLHELQLPDSLVQINKCAFCRSGLETIRIHDSVKVVQDSAFNACKNLRYAYISDAIQSIEQSCFDGCNNLEEVHLPKDLKEIGFFAFRGTNVKELWLPDTVEFVGSNNFTSPKMLLSRLRLSKALPVERSQYSIFNSWYIDTIYLPEGLEWLDLNYISDWHFKAIRFPKSVKLKNESVLCSSKIYHNLCRVEVYEGSDAYIKLSTLEELRDKLEIIK